MSEFTIIGLHLVDQAPMTGKMQLLCHFDLRCRGFRFLGCCLFRTPKAGFVIAAPKIENPRSGDRSVFIEDEPLRHRICDAVRERYRMFGGQYDDNSHVSPEGKPRDIGDVLASFDKARSAQ